MAYCQELEYEFVTCGSVLKLINTRMNVRLHSHDVKYGSGSGQQSVTAIDGSEDHNSYWHVRGTASQSCVRGTPVACGETIRLTHVSTNRNLHSHHFQSPLSHNLEVSAFGDDGEGDEGDNWLVQCADENWHREERIRLKHKVTGNFLHITGDTYGRPIHGQREVCTYPSPNEHNYWRAAEGVFIMPTDNSLHGNSHDEL